MGYLDYAVAAEETTRPATHRWKRMNVHGTGFTGLKNWYTLLSLTTYIPEIKKNNFIVELVTVSV